MSKPRLPLLLFLVLLLAAGCMVGPKYQQEAHDPKVAYSGALNADTTDLVDWTAFYDDPALVKLIRTTLDSNRTMWLTAARVEEARLLAGSVKADLYPQLGFSATAGGGSAGTDARRQGSGVDGGYFGDDYGAQRGLLFSPKLWRQMIKPRLARLFAVFREAGLPVILHSDGDIWPILPDLVDIGLTCLNPVQPEVLEHARLYREFGKDLSFYGGISTQEVLPKVSPADVRAATLACVRDLAPDGTGLIVGGGMRPVLEAAGVRDAVGKSLGSKNRLNVVKATVDALNQLRSAEEIAAARA